MTLKLSGGDTCSGQWPFQPQKLCTQVLARLRHISHPLESLSEAVVPVAQERGGCNHRGFLKNYSLPSPISPAQFLLIYLLLYLGIWISFAQVNPTWQQWLNPSETYTVNCSSAGYQHLLHRVFMYHHCMLWSEEQLHFVHLQLGNVKWDLKPDYKKGLRRMSLPDVMSHNFLNVGSWSLISDKRAIVHFWVMLSNIFSLQTVLGNYWYKIN